jgi:hypothetical protein
VHKSKHHFGEAAVQHRNRYQTLRVTEDESRELVEHARYAGLSVSQLVRQRALGQRAPVAAAPALNREAYQELSRTASNLNQLTHHLNQVQLSGQVQVIDLAQVRALLEKTIDQVAALRADLVGASKK